MAKKSLIVLAIVLFVGTFFVTQILITPQQKQQLRLVEQACNFNIYGIPVGQIGQAISSEAAAKCEEVKTASLIMTWGWLGYVIGFIILVMGLAIGGKKESVIREIIREPAPTTQRRELEEEPRRVEKIRDKGIKTTKTNFCGNCGEKLDGKEGFCPECGNKVL